MLYSYISEREEMKGYSFSEIFKENLLLVSWLFDGTARVRILIEVLEVCIAGQLWHPWRLYLLHLHHAPVHPLKPRMLLHIIGAIDHAA